ncbi:MAG: Na/Pi cotransporter family protein [Anaeromyxobacteraceae bacterium]
MHGLALTREGLQIVAGDKLRSILFALSSNRVVGLLSGAVVTTIIQSSTAVTVMLVGFAASSLMTLTQAMAVVLGADIGTTITVQLIAFRVSGYALAIVASGFAVRFFARKRRARAGGEAVMGFGLLFFGMKIMGDATLPLRTSPFFVDALEHLSRTPFAGLAVGAAATVLMQGSAPTIGVLIAMASSGSMSTAAAMPLVLGANIGTTITPIIAAAGQPPAGKRVAVAHALFKLVGVAAFLPVIGWFTRLAMSTAPDVARQIANAHTLFNVFTALAFLPFVGVGSRLVSRFYVEGEHERFGPRYLDPRAIESPALAFGNAHREFLRMADIVADMVKDCMRTFEQNDLDLAADIEARDDKVDILNREIRFYLARLGQEAMTPEQSERQMELISLANDIENVGDLVNRHVLALARKKVAHGLTFSREGWSEIRAFHEKVCENFDLALVAFSTADEEIARKVLRHREKLVEFEGELKEQHIARLNQGLRESLETSSVHLDLLAILRRINGYVGNMAAAVVRRRERDEEVRARE